MKRVLITGAGSSIGTKLKEHLANDPAFDVRELDVKGGVDASAFFGYDAVVHVAGLAHRKTNESDAELYHAVNCELAVTCAEYAKAAGVKQFVFFSSMSVYGMLTGHITADTEPKPNNVYGRSKWEAEQALMPLADDTFRVAVLRPPMVYGPGCKGNYPSLANLIGKTPVFPKVHSERSMIYVGTLCTFVKSLLLCGRGGLYFPQNRTYTDIAELAREVAACRKHKLIMVPGFGWAIRLLMPKVPLLAKVFGSLTYDLSMSTDFRDENELSFTETIRQTEGHA